MCGLQGAKTRPVNWAQALLDIFAAQNEGIRSLAEHQAGQEKGVVEAPSVSVCVEMASKR